MCTPEIDGLQSPSDAGRDSQRGIVHRGYMGHECVLCDSIVPYVRDKTRTQYSHSKLLLSYVAVYYFIPIIYFMY